MKKLLTLLGITAFALGAFADAALPSGTSFENHKAGEFDFTADEPETEGAKYWVSTASDIEASVAEYGSGEAFAKEVGRPAQFSGNNTQYLNIESASAPLYRAILPVDGELDTTDSLDGTNIGSGLYVDTLVQFSVAQGDQDVTDGNVKLAIWVQTGEEDGTPTNFYVHAGYFLDSSTLITNNYKMTTPQGFDFNGWHRLTVKAIGNIGGNFVGFVVFVDGDMLTRAGNATIGTSPELTAEAQQFAAGLLPSAVDNTNEGFNTLSAVGFSGNGSVDDISFTATAPDFAKSELVFSLTVGEGVTGFTLNDGQGNTTNVTGVAENDVVNFTIAGFATDVTVSAITYAADYKNATLSDEVQGTVNGLVFALNDGATNPGATISAVRDNFVVGGVGYATLTEALAHADAGTIELKYSYTIDGTTGINITSGDIVIDLAGNTLTGPAGDFLFDVEQSARLTIINTAESDGTVRGTYTYPDPTDDEDDVSSYPLFTGSGSLIVGSADDDGFVTVVGGYLGETSEISLVKGKFDIQWNTDDDNLFAFATELSQGSSVTTDSTFYVVDIDDTPVVTTYTVTYYTNDFVYATATYTLNDESTFTPPANPVVEGYDFGGWYTDNGTFETAFVFDETNNSDTDVYAKLTAKSMVIRIVKADTTTEDYTSVADALEDAEDGDTLVLLAACSDDIALPTGVAFDVGGYDYQGTVTAASGDGYEVVENGGVYAIVNNTASTWVGDDDDFWATASNWSTGLVPGQYTTVTFPNAGRVRFAEGNGSVNVGAMVVNANVTFSENNINYDNYPFINVCGGSISGTGTMTLERCGLKGNGTTLTVGCPVVFAGDSATSNDCFLQNGPIVFNGTVSSTLGRLHLQTPVTFNGAVNLENATMTSTVNGGAAPTFNGAVTLGAGATISTYAVTYNNALTIGEGAVVSVGSTTQNYGENFTMTGSGRFIGNTQMPGSKVLTALTQSTWTGTLELKGMTITQTNGLQTYGNADSKVCFNNVTTYLHRNGNAVGGIEVGAGGLKVNGTYSAGDWNLPELSGVGTFTVGTAGGGSKNFNFPADCSEFSGSIAFASDTANTRVVFGTTDREFKEKTICVGSDAVVGAGATWTASDEIYLDGIVKASANTSLSTVVGSGKIVYGAVPTGTHTFGEGWTGIGALDYKGADRIDLANYVNTIAAKCSCDTVEIVEGSTIPGRSYFNTDVVPTLKVSGFVSIGDGSSTTGNKRTIPTLTGDGVVDFQNYAQVNYAVNSVVDWNGVITNSSTAAFVTNIVSGTGTIVYSVFPANAGAPVVGSGFSGDVVLNFNASQKALWYYGGANSTIVLTDISGNNTYLPDGDFNSKVRIDGTVAIKNGNPLTANDSFNDWTNDRVITTPYLKVDGALSFAKTTGAGKYWSNLRCYYYAKVLDASGAGTIEVGNQFGLRIDAVDFAAAPSGTNCLVPLTLTEVPYVSDETQYVDVGRLYGPNGVAGEQIPVTVNGVATEQTLVYDAVKGGLVLYVASSEIDPSEPTELDVSPEATEAQAEEAAAAMDVTKTTAAASVEQSTWNGYFTKKVEKVNDKWVATAALNPAAVLPVDDTVEEAKLTDMLKSVTAAALDDKTTTASVPTKPGLYYWIAGATEVGATTYTPGTAVPGDGTTQALAMPVLSNEDGKAFYKVCVGLEDPNAE